MPQPTPRFNPVRWFPSSPAFGLLFGAVVWGLIWWPYRQLEQAGISGIQSSLTTYAVALFAGGVMLAPHLRAGIRWRALPIALVAGWTNLAYVLAVLEGEVMRVLLLFYLAPLWTLILARWLLDERAGWRGMGIAGLSLTGMLIMLWHGGDIPLPRGRAEWLALSAGFAFALANVLTRHAGDSLSLPQKSFAVWLGVCVFAMAGMLIDAHPLAPALFDPVLGLLMVFMGIVLAVTTWLVQYGVTHTPANRAAVIFMSELVVAAISSWLLAGETLSPREWLGGGLIILAALMPEKSRHI